MITFLQPLACGNAIGLITSGGDYPWRVVKSLDGDFDAPLIVLADGGAGSPMEQTVDYSDLTNGVPVFYRFDTLDGDDWTPGDPVSVTPAYAVDPIVSSPDLASFLHERLDFGLQAELAAGRIRHKHGSVPVLSAAPQLEQVALPVVTAILVDRRADVRGIGEFVVPDVFLTDADYWSSFEGWLDRSVVQIVAWSLNHEDRLDLRDAIQRVILLNLPILDAAGFVLPDLSSADTADFESYGAPIYQSAFTLSCSHAVIVRSIHSPVRTVETQVDVTS